MDPLKIIPLIPGLSPARSWVRRHLLVIIIAGAVLVDGAFIAFTHYGGRVSQLLQDHPGPLSQRQVTRLQRTARELSQEQARSQHAADSAYARVTAPERNAGQRQVFIHHLTTRYHALATDSANLSAAATANYLRHYAPGPDADL